ncbi:MAG: hypothetical protein AVDCRST_MAG37-2261 [uncultured Rubrobacteraceae bacterium]|uniref:Uncharacterized protein n=1 Tax=uncultured Rubrobacteraceae bacterium TaxID=349277 RepID=A0A6J4QX47_9ACTN|nr:MAG: hypothetical protein AVDCRST_MAG37-2261 [uncultured Rubrobacteraceae bacterium]
MHGMAAALKHGFHSEALRLLRRRLVLILYYQAYVATLRLSRGEH